MCADRPQPPLHQASCQARPPSPRKPPGAVKHPLAQGGPALRKPAPAMSHGAPRSAPRAGAPCAPSAEAQGAPYPPGHRDRCFGRGLGRPVQGALQLDALRPTRRPLQPPARSAAPARHKAEAASHGAFACWAVIVSSPPSLPRHQAMIAYSSRVETQILTQCVRRHHGPASGGAAPSLRSMSSIRHQCVNAD